MRALCLFFDGMLKRHLALELLGTSWGSCLGQGRGLAAGDCSSCTALPAPRGLVLARAVTYRAACRVWCWTTGPSSSSGRDPTWHASHWTQGWTSLQAQAHTASSSTSGEPPSSVSQRLQQQSLSGRCRPQAPCKPHLLLKSVEHIRRDVEGGGLRRYMHANGASMICVVVASAGTRTTTTCCGSMPCSAACQPPPTELCSQGRSHTWTGQILCRMPRRAWVG